MTVLGMPLSMFLVFVATVLAGSLGAIHYVVFHILLKRPFADEGHALKVRTASGRASGDGDHGTGPGPKDRGLRAGPSLREGG